MTDADTTPRRGRRARELSPEEHAALESRTAAVVTGETSPVPGARGAVAVPEADAAVPKLRKFGRRARIIELSDPADEQAAGTGTGELDTGDSTGESAHENASTAGDSASHAPGDDSTDPETSTPEPSAPEPPTPEPSTPGPSTPAPEPAPADQADPRPARRTTNGDRDRDGVELGELPVSEAPNPRPAPRFDGKVLHRPERSGGRPLLWVVWILIAVAGVVLVALLLSGVLGSDTAALGAILQPAVTDSPALFDIRSPLEVAAA